MNTPAETIRWLEDRATDYRQPDPDRRNFVDAHALVKRSQETCTWSELEPDSDGFSTACGHDYIINEGDHVGMNYCTYCGRKMHVERAVEETPTDETQP